ncbi:dTDP-4-dehydrorhamnose 3,5-epimerase [Streptacidiphilus sp. MAP12-33]|uniref:dTDP-4-dehydrorhamnose 3,5-epimerase family protein n=1 Tax=Streptacidiphilus sp. MAP12-33 TaxID=3156266 RepID=UPI003512D894
MKIRPLAVEGAWEITPQQHSDPRGTFLEWYRPDLLTEAGVTPFAIEQANISVSAADVVRGVHFADVPPGQAKYITCVNGVAWDVIIDLRVGSPTFGLWESVLLDASDRRAVYLSEGLGHAFCSLAEGTTVAYFCSTRYAPLREHTVHPLDPDLAITWPVRTPLLSDRDAAAPRLAEMLTEGRLPRYLQDV